MDATTDPKEQSVPLPPEGAITVKDTTLLPAYFRQNDRIFIREELPFKGTAHTVWFQTVDNAEVALAVEKLIELKRQIRSRGFLIT